MLQSLPLACKVQVIHDDLVLLQRITYPQTHSTPQKVCPIALPLSLMLPSTHLFVASSAANRRPGEQWKRLYSLWLYAALSLVLICVLRSSRCSPCSPFPLLSPFRAGRGRLPHSSAIADATSVFLPRHDKIRPSPDLMCIFTVGVSVPMCVCMSERERERERVGLWAGEHAQLLKPCGYGILTERRLVSAWRTHTQLLLMQAPSHTDVPCPKRHTPLVNRHCTVQIGTSFSQLPAMCSEHSKISAEQTGAYVRAFFSNLSLIFQSLTR